MGVVSFRKTSSLSLLNFSHLRGYEEEKWLGLAAWNRKDNISLDAKA
jgi:hypothetical protein